MFNSAIYQRSPVWVQELLLAGRGFARSLAREGLSFRRISAEVNQTQWLSGERLETFTQSKLRETLQAAVDGSPYYTTLFSQLGLDIRTMSLPADITRLPYMDKADIRAAGKALLSRRNTGLRVTSSTSGTTGSPLQLHQDLDAINRENAFIWRQLTWAGMKPGDRRVWLRGDMIVPADKRMAHFGEKIAAITC